MILVFTGIQGCGKGTQARLLEDNYGYTLLEMGQELRNIITSGNELGLKIKGIMESGGLVSPEIVGEVMKEILSQQTSDKLILDGFVRNEGNRASLEAIVDDYKVVFFELSKEKAINRLLGRMFNKTTGETFPSGTLVDPVTGEELIKRKDDNETSILKRIDEFMNNTLPTAEKQKEDGLVVSVNADQPIKDVANEMVEKLGL